MTSVAYSVAKVVPITPFLLGIQVLIKGLQLPRWGTPSGRESPAFTYFNTPPKKAIAARELKKNELRATGNSAWRVDGRLLKAEGSFTRNT